MNVYDTANRLASEIRQSEEYVNYKNAKEVLDANFELKDKMAEFEKARYEVQLEMMQTGKNNEEKYKKVQELYSSLVENEDAKKYFEFETKFNVLITDINFVL